MQSFLTLTSAATRPGAALAFFLPTFLQVLPASDVTGAKSAASDVRHGQIWRFSALREFWRKLDVPLQSCQI